MAEITDFYFVTPLRQDGSCLLCAKSRIRGAFIREQQKAYPVTVICCAMRVSTRAYDAWTNNSDRQNKTKEEAELKEKVEQIFYENKQVYGSRRMADALSKIGVKAGRYQVTRLMAELGIK